jgi:small-conductance mechanosensitive channel
MSLSFFRAARNKLIDRQIAILTINAFTAVMAYIILKPERKKHEDYNRMEMKIPFFRAHALFLYCVFVVTGR